MADERRLDIKVRMNSGELDENIKKTKTELSVFQSEVKRTDAELKAYGKSTETLGAKQSALTKTIDKQEDQMESLQVAYDASVASSGKASKQSMYLERQMNTLGAQLARNKGELNSVDSELAKLSSGSTEAAGATQSLSQKLSSADQNIAAYKSELNKTASEMQLFGKNADTVGNKVRALEGVYSAQASKMDVLKRAYDEQVRESGQASQAAQQLKTQMNNLGAEMNSTRSQIDQTNSSLGEVEEAGSGSAAALDSIAGSGKALVAGQLAQGIMALGEKLKDIGVAAMESFGQVNNSVGDLRAAFGITKGEAEKLHKSARNIAKEGFIPSMEEATQAIIIAKNQVRGLNDADLEKVVRQAGTLEKVFGADMEETLKGVNALMVSYGLTAEEALDYITVGSQNGLDKTHELGDNLAEYSTLFHDAGYSATDMFNILQSGLDGGAYNLNKVNDLVKEFGVRLSDGTVEKGMAGLSTYAQEAFQTFKNGGMTQAQLFRKLGGEIMATEGDTQKLAAAAAIFGTQGEDAGAGVLEAMSLVALEGEGVKTIYEETGGAAEKAAQAAVGPLDKLKGKWEDLVLAMAPIGERIIDMLMPMVDFIEKIIAKLEKIDPGTLDFLVQLGVVIAIATPIIGGFVAVLGVLAGTAAAIGVALAPFIAVIAAIIAAVVAVVLAIMNWDKIIKWVKEKWGELTVWLGEVWEKLKEKSKEIWESMGESIAETWNKIKAKAKEIWDGIIKSITDTWENFKTSVKTKWDEIMAPIVAVWTSFKEKTKEIWDSVIQTIADILSAAFEIITLPLRILITAIILIWEGLKLAIGAIWDAIGDKVMMVWDFLSLAATLIFNTIKNGIIGAWTTVSEFTMGVWNTVSEFIGGIWRGISDRIGIALEFIKLTIGLIWNSIKETTSNIFNGIKTVITDVWDAISRKISIVVDFIKLTVGLAWNGIKTVTSNIFNGVKDTTTSVWDGISRKIKIVVDFIKLTVGLAWNGIKDATSGTWNAIKGAVTTALDAMSGPIDAFKVLVKGVGSVFKGLFNTISNVMDSIVNAITKAWDKAGKILDKLNPFNSEGTMNVTTDGDPYNPAMGPMAANGISGAIGSIQTALGSVRNGINTSMSNMGQLYSKRNNGQFNTVQQAELPQNENIYYEISIPVQLDGRTIAKATARFSQEELNKQMRRSDRMKGDI